MSNALTTSNLPQHLQALVNNTNLQHMNQQAVAGISAGKWPQIGIKGGRFRLRDAQGQEIVVPVNALDIIIVGVNSHGLSKRYYAGAYDPSEEGNAPDCYSDNGVAPSSRSAKPQCSTCAACPHNVWGSKVNPNGAQTRACSDLKKIAVLLAENTSGPAFELDIPAASLANFGAYVRGLDSAGIPAASIITRLAFDTAADYPKLLFGPLPVQEGYSPYITAEMLADVMEVVGSDEVKLCTGEDDKPLERAVNVAATTVIAQTPLTGAPFVPPPNPNFPHAGTPAHPQSITVAEAAQNRAIGAQAPLPFPTQRTVTTGYAPAPAIGNTVPGVPAEAEKPKRTRRTKAQMEMAQPAAAPLGAASGYAPPPPGTGSIIGGMPMPPGQPANPGRDAQAPVSAGVTDPAMDELIRKAMSV